MRFRLFLLATLAGAVACTPHDNPGVDYYAVADKPKDNRFSKVVLDQGLYEPMELDFLDDNRIIFVQRRGEVLIHDIAAGTTEEIYTFDVYHEQEDGLMGVAVDPNYAETNWVYIIYSPPGPEAKQHVSRFTLTGNTLDRSSEKVLIEIPTQRDECCHSGGSLEFDAQGNLYISVGDDTNPFDSDGFSPSDERPGRSPWDAQKSSANLNDLRGGILRITPQPDGTYTIPEGNLTPADGSAGRPELYVKGTRNPFRIAIDQRTGYLYWGDVGPDAGEDIADRGPRGHDEVNQARAAGFFGWPYFIGNNKAYHDYDFATKETGEEQDPAAPVNDSPNNTGPRELPPAQPAYIYYPYAQSPDFDLVGEGGRNAMAGPVYYFDDYGMAEDKLPRYYDGKFFAYDWMRGWIMAVTMDEQGDMVSMERFMPRATFNNPMDIVFDRNGVMYLLEYGTGWFSENDDARLVRIDFNPGNRAPEAVIAANTTVGAAPLTVAFDAADSSDPDADDLLYRWSFADGSTAEGPAVEHTFAQAGVQRATLTVSDGRGEESTSFVDILVGNAMPDVTIDLVGNRTFYWDDRPLTYQVHLTDAEDGSLADGTIAEDGVTFTLDYLAEGFDLTGVVQGHEALAAASQAAMGEQVMSGETCSACHNVAEASIGPSYLAISDRYKEEEGAIEQLATKVIQGGGGVWGEHAMAAHPHLSPAEAESMIHYIFSLDEPEKPIERRPLQGTYAARDHIGGTGTGQYILTASYEDRGGEAVGPLKAQASVVLRNPKVQAEQARLDSASVLEVEPGTIGNAEELSLVVGTPGGTATYPNIDLTGLKSVTLHTMANPEQTQGGTLELRKGNAEGEVLGRIAIAADAVGSAYHTIDLAGQQGVTDLTLVFTDAEGERPVAAVDYMVFAPAD
ncbi:MAG: PQQ-dependent sugar dehydrogenase [Bacteroidota bacterium]